MKRKNCMKRKYMFMALLCYALTTAAQDASHNYVRTRSMLDETGGKYEESDFNNQSWNDSDFQRRWSFNSSDSSSGWPMCGNTG